MAALLLSLLFCHPNQETPQQIQTLVRDLGASDYTTREEAQRKLMNLGPSAKTELEKALNSPDREIQARAKWLLKCIAATEGLSADFFEAVPRGAERLAAGAVIEVFLEEGERLTEADGTILAQRALQRATTVEQKLQLIEEIQSRKLIGASAQIVRMIADESEFVRWMAVFALRSMNVRQASREIAEVLKDESASVREVAIDALVDMDAGQFSHQIVCLLVDDNSDVRRSAARALGRLDAQQFRGEIGALLFDEPNVRTAAALSLDDLMAEEFVPQFAVLLENQDQYTRECAAKALGTFNATQYTHQIAHVLERDASAWAAVTLGLFGAKQYAPQVAKLLQCENYLHRIMAIVALEDMNAKEFSAQIAMRLEDEEDLVRLKAVSSLGELGAKRFKPQIAKLLEDEDPAIRRSADKALKRIDGKKFVP